MSLYRSSLDRSMFRKLSNIVLVESDKENFKALDFQEEKE